jgi:hypothetical protein
MSNDDIEHWNRIEGNAKAIIQWQCPYIITAVANKSFESYPHHFIRIH